LCFGASPADRSLGINVTFMLMDSLSGVCSRYDHISSLIGATGKP
jgi:hypothetical protein